MARLGHPRYGVQGGDIGAAVAPEVGRVAPDRVIGVHTSGDRAGFPRSRCPRTCWIPCRPSNRTRPQFVGYGLCDSPIGQLAWVMDKFREWTHPRAALPDNIIDRDRLLTNVMLYGLTGTAGSAAYVGYAQTSSWGRPRVTGRSGRRHPGVLPHVALSLGNEPAARGAYRCVTFKFDDGAKLLEPLQVGDTLAGNRLFMAPLTRSRADADGTPSDLAATYYSQRAAAGLIITEATSVSRTAGGAYLNTPGVYTDRHQHKWAEVASAVHAAGGRIFMQLWHVGRMGHPEISGVESVAPSAIAADVVTHTPSGKKPVPVPRALDNDEIPGIVHQFRAAARRAIDAGMDGVEIHGANGYLLHQFQSDVTNQRTDAYGGSPENRARLTAEIVEAVVDEVGAGRVGLRLSPGNSAGGMREVDSISVYEALLDRICPLGIAYLHLLIDPSTPAFGAIRGQWQGTLVLNTGREVDTDFCQMETWAEWGVLDAYAVGRAFLANPDLMERLAEGAELNEPDVSTFYAPGAAGYVDYPTLAESPQLPSVTV